jgi:hypothetical protein
MKATIDDEVGKFQLSIVNEASIAVSTEQDDMVLGETLLDGVVAPEISTPAATPTAQDSNDNTSSRQVLMLYAVQSFKREVVAQQSMAKTILDAHEIPFIGVDGSDPANKDQRSALFRTSGLYGQYPQFFLVDPDGTAHFWGDYDRVEQANDEGVLKAELLPGTANDTQETPPNVVAPAVASVELANDIVPEQKEKEMPPPLSPSEESLVDLAYASLSASDSLLGVVEAADSIAPEQQPETVAAATDGLLDAVDDVTPVRLPESPMVKVVSPPLTTVDAFADLGLSLTEPAPREIAMGSRKDCQCADGGCIIL